eukprot:scaffold5927_cov215-Prasinococcus_capsulatus_cf.AAC.1
MLRRGRPPIAGPNDKTNPSPKPNPDPNSHCGLIRGKGDNYRARHCPFRGGSRTRRPGPGSSVGPTMWVHFGRTRSRFHRWDHFTGGTTLGLGSLCVVLTCHQLARALS